MYFQAVVAPVYPEDFPRVVNVWEASVRATHNFVTEADIQFFKPFVREGIPHVAELACVRDGEGEVIGFIGITGEKSRCCSFTRRGIARGSGAAC